MERLQQSAAILVATFLVVWLVAAVAGLSGTVAADKHTYEDAENYTEAGNFTIEAYAQTDHYPGDQNKENGSIIYYAKLADIIYEVGGENGTWSDFIIINADWIDYSACDTENTAVFGIDRNDTYTGTQVDEDLVEHQEKVTFRDDGLTINFLDWNDFGGDPPYFNPRGDEIVANQGGGSNGGTCLTYTSEPGWYTLQGFLNGTEAKAGCTEEGNADCQPPESAEKSGGYMWTRPYFYICECDSREEARDKLGPPPNKEGESTPTPTQSGETPTATPTATPAPSETPTATPEPDDTPTATAADDTGDDTGEDTPANTETQAQNGGSNTTPTVGGGPGFGAILTLTGLLASALLLRRRS
ncbi:MAG: PGF-CTERM protein [Natronomonas sp.]|jgi:PGF-CTERM protein|uniref:PGF-CTERM sorting domain-containing protein n=1 Tax=Natronomonas sp. TaxID=2184060 RepID=UPI0039892C10